MLRVHPQHLLGEDEHLLLRMFFAWRGGMGGHGPLPVDGGYGDQPAGIMAAFDFMAGVAAKAEKKEAPGGKGKR